MRLSSLRFQWPRIRHQLGVRLAVGSRRMRVRGYVPNRLTTGTRHEPHLMAPLARAMATRGGIVVDVGVNTGQTLLKILSIDPDRPYLGFEPQAGCCFFVSQFLRDNDLRNARVVCLALSDANRLLPLHSEGAFDEMATLSDLASHRHHAAVTSGFVPARIGDEVLAEMGVTDPGIIKVDVERAEVSVFAGLRGTIARARPICFFEVVSNLVGADEAPLEAADAAANRAEAGKLFRLFGDLRYEIRQIHPDGSERTIDRFELDDPARHVGDDYVAYPIGGEA